MTTKHQEVISAEKKSIGFDYQFLYFIYNLIPLEPGQVVGYEVKDDVHLELPGGENIYMQLKHSLTTKATGEIGNLTEKDSDLWKTLYNWIVIIRQTSEDKVTQLKFIKNTKFLMVTNKSQGSNPFIIQVSNLKHKTIDVIKFKSYVQGVRDSCKGTESASIKLRMYMEQVLEMDEEILEAFILKVEFNFSFDEMPQKLTNKVLAKNIDKRKVEGILHEIIGAFEIWKFEKVKNKKKLLIGFEEVDKKLRPILQRGRSEELPRIKRNLIFPDELKEQEFIKELLEIEDIEEDDDNLILEFTTYKIEIFNLISRWIEEGYITEWDKQELEEEAIRIWKNKHRKVHKKSDKVKRGSKSEQEVQEVLKESAQQCIDELREEILPLNACELRCNESNGLFYYLSDIGEIGWQYKWRGKYK